MNPSLCLNTPKDATQSVLICNPSVPSDSSTNQKKQKTLLDKDNNSHSFQPSNNAFSYGSSIENHSPYPSNYIVISIIGNNHPNNFAKSSGHASSYHFQRHTSLTHSKLSLKKNADFLTKLTKTNNDEIKKQEWN